MNKDAEAIDPTDRFLAWLLQEPNPAVSAPSGKNSSQGTGPDKSGAVDLQLRYLDPLDSAEVDGTPTRLEESGHFPYEEVSLFKSGEIPAVQDRFYTLIKHRLRAEIERNPPLFPWETEANDYEETPDSFAPGLLSSHLWTTQLQTLELPIPMPDSLLIQLFEQCQAVVQSSLREGVKLVQAVESLFPGHSQALNHLAGLVLVSPTRSATLLPPQTEAEMMGFPSHYDVANTTQQMALSLLAARKILDATTFTLTSDQLRASREWATVVGLLSLSAEYQPQTQRLRIHARFPCPGSLRLQGGAMQAIAAAAAAGELSAELTDVEPNQSYALEVQLQGIEHAPLVFAVCPTTDD